MAPRALTREELLDEVAHRFGSDARFHTCVSDNLSAPELIEFLESRGKLVCQGAGITSDGQPCSG